MDNLIDKFANFAAVLRDLVALVIVLVIASGVLGGAAYLTSGGVTSEVPESVALATKAD